MDKRDNEMFTLSIGSGINCKPSFLVYKDDSDNVTLQIDDETLTSEDIKDMQKIVPNPELDDSVEVLTGLQIGDEKYKVGDSEGKVYLHSFTFVDSSYTPALTLKIDVLSHIGAKLQDTITKEEFSDLMLARAYNGRVDYLPAYLKGTVSKGYMFSIQTLMLDGATVKYDASHMTLAYTYGEITEDIAEI